MIFFSPLEEHTYILWFSILSIFHEPNIENAYFFKFVGLTLLRSIFIVEHDGNSKVHINSSTETVTALH